MPIPHSPLVRRWCPLNDLEWHALYPYLIPRSPAGRQVGDLRRRMDAIFQMACGYQPWKNTPEAAGKPDTVARYFRRLARKGLWERLLDALRDIDPRHPLAGIRDFIFRACRRATRLLGLKFIVLIRRLDMRSALNGPPWALPDPDLSETLQRLLRPAFDRRDFPQLRRLYRLLRASMGRRYIPRFIRMGWP
jgi:transposase